MSDETENEKQYEKKETKTFTIEDGVKMKREKRLKEQKEFEEKLKVLKEKTRKLKKELGYE
ncbi:hypothetical protein [Sphingobium sp. TCM1]|uniref:hypothetical protein n=1 Tax=Sphingobium sp. TCM1 TaxID=453246 RepID=UPI0007F4778F|nr:hypothetical protein [Sphingobium sp. TCM1]OAN52965.1 hypothetical protein A7Q26_24375 [Sphingobium sp. TCM1]